ncbi:MAG: uracil-DNA glycosylase [Candidatus Tectomicrobia bacterium]|nr:uracil-DNA glycosylase [Candidatus Tectomicrobia bacterium]
MERKIAESRRPATRAEVRRQLFAALRGALQYQRSLGVEWLPASAALGAFLAARPGAATPPTLASISETYRDCQRCRLGATRQNLVFGVGNPHAKLVFVGEAPGRDEDLQGEPFVGRAGQLLTRIIEAMGLRRDEVYICNIIKCRPPQNRNPRGDEIEACEPILRQQLRAIQPKLICTLGTVATQTLLRSQASIGDLRGRFHTYEGIPVMPTYHPAYLLRNPEQKRAVWEDMKKVKAEYEKV